MRNNKTMSNNLLQFYALKPAIILVVGLVVLLIGTALRGMA